MKKFFVFFAVFATLIFVAGCGDSKNEDKTDTGDTVNDEDSADSGSTDTGTPEPTDTGTTEPTDTGTIEPTDTGEPDTAPDGGDTAPVPDGDNGDSTPDGGDTEPDNDYPQTPCDPNPCISDANSTGVCTIKNDSYVCGCKYGYIFDGTLCIKSLPECSPTSDTPCIDSATGLIWSAKSENKMPWNDAVNYCQDLTEGDFNDWRLPSIAVLKTLVQNCSSEKCSDDYTGKYSKFGDTVYLWSSSVKKSSSEGVALTAQSIYFSDASTQAVNVDTNVNVRCVRREAESRETNCTGLIENSVWNTASQITQTWDWETVSWTPSPEGSYNTNPSTSACRFKCDSNSFRDGSRCLNPCKPNPCNSIGETGTCLSKSANEYICECEENYFLNDSSHCLNPCESNPCTSIGETGICLGKNANEYSCECEESYVWNPSSNKCMKNPCLNTQCNIPNSTGTCNPVTETQYTCECEENFYWWGENGGCTTQRPGFGNICTGQSKCYGNSLEITCPTSSTADFFGQDAQYAVQGVCTPQSFTVQTISSQNVVVDNNTGLTWEKSPSSGTYTWDDAPNHCNDLNSSNYGGINTWRLPNPLELLSIVDNSTYNPATNSNFTNMPSDSSVWFWTSAEYKGNTSYAYAFVPYGGSYHGYNSNSNSDSYSKTKTYKVLCVSGDEMQPATSSNFTSQTISGAVVVTDSNTGLMWQKEYETGQTWKQALKYCEDSTYAGYSDWRLPNKNELASLINYEKSGAPYSYFPDMPSDMFWSSSSVYVSLVSTAWFVDFGNGGVGNGLNGAKTSGRNVRCVR